MELSREGKIPPCDVAKSFGSAGTVITLHTMGRKPANPLMALKVKHT